MPEALNAQLLRWARVPPEPHVPEGSRDSVRVFRAGQNYYKLLLVKAALGYLGPLVALIVITAAASAPSIASAVRTVWVTLDMLAWAVLLASMVVTFLIVRLNYEMRWYIVT